ncbi:MAG TPA: DUF4136 domain-containing protein [Chthoniobacterales bacterium]
MKISSRLSFVLATFFLASCSTLTVNTDHDPRVNFAKYHTYDWAPQSNQGYSPSPSTAALIQETLDQDLSAKGYRKSSNPDFLISYHVTRRHKQSVSQVTQFVQPGFGGYGPYMYNDWGFGPGPRFRGGFGYYGLWPEYPVTYTEVTPYVQGSLVVDFVDTRTHQSVWRGIASAVVGDRATNQKNALEGIRQMLLQFPPHS